MKSKTLTAKTERSLLLPCLFAVLLVAVLIFCALHAEAASVVASGDCGANGSNVRWSLDSDGVLTISGKGEMADYPYPIAVPWESYLVKSLVIQSGVTHVGSYICYSEDKLTSVSLPNTITSIGENCFFGCEKITEIVIPKSVTEIGAHSFSGCDGLKSITFPKSVKKIGEDILGNCESLKSIQVESGNANYISDDGILLTKDRTLLLAYPSQRNAKQYTIPKTVTRIGEAAFANCDKLETIDVPKSVSSIGNYAFSYCDNLKSMVIPAGVKEIEEYTFYSCVSLQTISIPEGVTSIGNLAFDSCIKLQKVSLPSTLEEIGYRAFDGCSSVVSYDVARGNQYFSSEDGVLFHNQKTELIRYPSGNTRASYSIPNSVKYISELSFENCKNLVEVAIPNSVTTIGDNAFMDCCSLIRVTIPKSVTSLGGLAFYYCDNLAAVSILGNMSTIDNSTFSGCSNLKIIYFSKSVSAIGSGAFYNSNNLSDVYYGGSSAEWNRIAIDEDYNEPLLSAKVHFSCSDLPNVYAVAYNSKWGDDTPAPQLKEVNKDLTISKQIPQKRIRVRFDANGGTCAYDEREMNAVFSSWNTKADGSGTSYRSGAVYKKNADVALYAQWSYGGEGNLPTPSRKGYDFAGWYTQPKGGEKITYQNMDQLLGSDYVLNTIYAHWTAHTHTYKTVIERKATCQQTGYQYQVCKLCGERGNEKTLPKLAHNYQSKMIAATTGKNGKTYGQCTICGAVKKYSTIPRIATLKLEKASYVYDGKAKTPALTVKDSKGKTLKKNTDYKVKYAAGRTDCGVYKVVLKFMGNYSGKQTLTFQIVPVKVTGLKQTKGSGIRLAWNETGGATYFEIYYVDKNTSTYRPLNDKHGNPVQKQGTTLKNTNISAGTVMKFKVRAVVVSADGSVVKGPFSKVLTATAR